MELRGRFSDAMCKKAPVAVIRLSQGSIQSSGVKRRDTSRLNKIVSHLEQLAEENAGKERAKASVRWREKVVTRICLVYDDVGASFNDDVTQGGMGCRYF